MAIDPGTVEPLTVWIGWDSREALASDVCASSIIRHTKHPVQFRYLKHRKLRKQGLFYRPWLVNGESGEWQDLLDGRPFSTEFSHTRFLIPELQQFKGWALFMDADMIFADDIVKLFKMKKDRYAAMCVKHNHDPKIDTSKMDGRVQLRYYRKNWSSFVLWNCGHLANRGLTKEKVNFMKGNELHAFSWLNGEDHIGALPFNYNYISGISPKLPIIDGKQLEISVYHYTEGGPWFDECKQVPYADLWDRERRIWEENGAQNYDGYLHVVET